jgi:XTP/dITP diphosphohydrolase
MQPIILATHNAHKLQELQTLLQDMPFALQIAPADLPEVEETGLTFIENALLKARSAAKHTGKGALGDDSGLVVPYLNGAPGIYSARYAGHPVNFQKNIAKLLNELHSAPEDKRIAYFYCCLVLMRHADDPQPIIAEGIWHGKIMLTPKGEHGFGYDPVFWVEEKQCSAAELVAEQKNKISHRGRAIQLLREKLKDY